jgi:hypothetical protein
MVCAELSQGSRAGNANGNYCDASSYNDFNGKERPIPLFKT